MTRSSWGILLLGLTACAPDRAAAVRGFWGKPDAGLVVFESGGKTHWYANGLYLDGILTSFSYQCGMFEQKNGEVVYVGSDTLTDSVDLTTDPAKLSLDLPPAYVDEQFRYRFRDAGINGQVALVFSATLDVTPTDRARFEWRAEYRDSARELSVENGANEFERASTCQ